jgi:predicted ATPase
MAKLEGFRIRNFRSLKDISMGRLWKDWNTSRKPLTPMTAVIGKNGAGKSTLFDAFGFLADCLKVGVEEACDSPGRGGYPRIHSQGQHGPIEFEVYYKEDRNSRPITYELAIDLDKSGRPFVSKERLRQRRKGQESGRPFSFLIIDNGRGVAWKGEEQGQDVDEEGEGFNIHSLLSNLQEGKNEEESRITEIVELEDKRKLGIATLGSLKQHPRISAFRRFIEGWYLSYFSPDASRGLPHAGPQRHLNSIGDNIGNVVQFMERDQTKRFRSILDRIAKKIPGIENIDTRKTDDGRLLLRFNEKGFIDPFYAQQMSDGTMKIFAYLLLLEDPSPPPFLCIEEPENGLYHRLLEPLAKEFRAQTERKPSAQVFITTHQPYLVDALEPEEVWVLEKGSDGFSKIRRASDDPIVRNMVAEGLPLGGLWFSDYLEGRQSNAL